MNEKPFVNDGNILIIPNGTKLHTTEKSSNGWYKVTYDGQTGWIDGQYTTALNTNISPEIIGRVTVTSPIGLWMNNGPSTTSGNIVCLNDNTTLNVIGQKNGWYEVQYDGLTGWVDGQYTTTLKSNNKSTNNNPQNSKNNQILYI